MSTSKITGNNGSSIASNYITIPLKNETLLEVVDKAKDWAVMHGVGFRSKLDPNAIVSVPFILLPTPFPRFEFEKAVSIQPIINDLIHKVANDYEFLKDSLKNTIKIDEFTKKLFEIYETVRKEGVVQDISLGILRSDYMLDTNNFNQIKQVEINTMAAGCPTLATRIYELNRFVLSELGQNEKLKNLPENNALTETSLGMLKAWELYNNKNSVIMFLNDSLTLNICDSRIMEFEICKLNRDVKTIRRTLAQVANSGELGPKKELIIDGYEVAVVYFRSGFTPHQYDSDKDWDARLLIERSLAIKCPSINYHLAGTKKVQETLAKPNALDKYLNSSEAIRSVNETFTGLYSLDFNEYGEQAISMALENPERFVLKPEREGGGNNVYGTDVREVLLKMKNSPERTAWILMDKINPPITQGYMIRPNNPGLPEIVDLVSELGVFGVIIGNSSTIFYNNQSGFLLRSKLSTENEGGVIQGYGAVDGPFLFDYENKKGSAF